MSDAMIANKAREHGELDLVGGEETPSSSMGKADELYEKVYWQHT